MECIILGAGTSPLMSTGCLAPQALWLFQAASTLILLSLFLLS